MHYALLHGLKKKRVFYRIWPTCPDAGIDIFWRVDLVAFIMEEKQVDMGKAALLELNGINVCDRLSTLKTLGTIPKIP